MNTALLFVVGGDVGDLGAPADRTGIPLDAVGIVYPLPERVRRGRGGLVLVPPLHWIVEPEEEGEREDAAAEANAPDIVLHSAARAGGAIRTELDVGVYEEHTEESAYGGVWANRDDERGG